MVEAPLLPVAVPASDPPDQDPDGGEEDLFGVDEVVSLLFRGVGDVLGEVERWY